jgi:hypothetical protein
MRFKYQSTDFALFSSGMIFADIKAVYAKLELSDSGEEFDWSVTHLNR